MMRKPSAVNTVDEIRQRLSTLLHDYAFDTVCWVGLFGSFSRSSHTAESDVDLIVGYDPCGDSSTVLRTIGYLSERAPEVLGRRVDVVHMMRPEAGTYLLLEALLSNITVYGSEEWPSRSKRDALQYLESGYLKFTEAYRFLCLIQQEVDKTTKEVMALLDDLTLVVLSALGETRAYYRPAASHRFQSEFRGRPSISH
jgi:predicted nucleotidyltransferase